MDHEKIDTENTNNGHREVDREDQELQSREESLVFDPREHESVSQEEALLATGSSETAVDSGNDFCCCAWGKVEGSESDSDERGERCPLCGKVMAIGNSSSTRSGTQFVDRRPPSAGGTKQMGLFLAGQAFANELNFLPDNADTSSQSNNSSMAQCVRLNSTIPRQERPTVVEQGNIPLEGDLQSSTQMPSAPTLLTFFTTVSPQAGTNGLMVSLYMVPLDLFTKEAFVRWLQENRSDVATIGDELFSQEENRPFHTENTRYHVDVNCELLRKQFRIVNFPATNRVPLTRIISSSQYRIPGPIQPIAKFFVQCLPAEPGEIGPPQDHLRMTLTFDGSTIRRMLIPIWCPRETDET